MGPANYPTDRQTGIVAHKIACTRLRPWRLDFDGTCVKMTYFFKRVVNILLKGNPLVAVIAAEGFYHFPLAALSDAAYCQDGDSTRRHVVHVKSAAQTSDESESVELNGIFFSRVRIFLTSL